MGTETRVIIGAGGHAKVIYDIYVQLGKKVDYFVDKSKTGMLYGIPILSEEAFDSIQNEEKQIYGVIAIVNAEIRKEISERVSIHYETVVHPKAVVAGDVSLGKGTVVMAGAILNSGTLVGKHCILNTGSIIEYDNVLGDFVHMAPRSTTAGKVTVEDFAHVGLGAVIIEGKKVEKNAYVGAGSVVIDDVFEFQTVVGVPARPMQKLRGF